MHGRKEGPFGEEGACMLGGDTLHVSTVLVAVRCCSCIGISVEWYDKLDWPDEK